MNKSHGYAATDQTSPLTPFQFERRDVREEDVFIEILYCGICHSDIHQARNEWGAAKYPMVPGHEIVGKVLQVGAKVSKFKVGDVVGVGCMVDSCKACSACKDGLEQYCENGFTGTYNGVDKKSGEPTFGGYSNNIVVNQEFVLNIPKNLELSQVAPLLCAGITTFSPLRHWKVGKGDKVGVIGLGGLGHMAVKLAHSFGAHVVVFTTSPSKVADAKRLGADEVVISKNVDEVKKHVNSFDFILNTVPELIDLGPYLELLKLNGALVIVGVPSKGKAPTFAPGNLIFKRRQIAGSLIGGIPETQEMLDYCGKHNIACDVEVVNIDQVNEAFERAIKSDVRYRFVIDMKSLKS
jgi:uncharacterized zinc-type alcohol dehydrogenase-like protein